MVEFIPSPLPWPLEASGCDVYYSWIEALKAGVHDDTLYSPLLQPPIIFSVVTSYFLA